MSNGPILSAANRYRCNGCTRHQSVVRHGRTLHVCTHAEVAFAGLAFIGLTDATPDWCPLLKAEAKSS